MKLKPQLIRLGLLVLGIAAGAILIVFLIKRNPSVHVDEMYPADGASVGGWARVEVHFTGEVNHASAESALLITPTIEGEWVWEGATLLRVPTIPMPENSVYKVEFTSAVKTPDGKTVKTSKPWQFTIRPIEVLYLSPAGESGTLYRLNPESNQLTALTGETQSVVGYGISPDGEQVVYSVLNAENGINLWWMTRAGAERKQLVNCGENRCITPVFSIDNQVVAYRQEEPSGAGRIWTVDLGSGQAAPLFQDEEIQGEFPSFSPNGEYLSFYDLNSEGIRILNLQTSELGVLPTAQPGSGNWSPDGNILVYADIFQEETGVFSALFQAEMTGQKTVSRFLTEEIAGVDFLEPAWSPDSQWIAVGVRPRDLSVNRQLLLINRATKSIQSITDDPLASHAFYSWNPWGTRLLIQRYVLGSSASKPEVIFWDRGSETLRILVEDAMQPEWLP